VLYRKCDKPWNTVHWLNARSWCLRHHYVRCLPGILSMEWASRLVWIADLLLYYVDGFFHGLLT
jgi:hypothetical protein